jgi:glycosyltransferase domain-containing protein
MNSDFPLVSIGIPTFNRANTLVKCLESILEQTYKNLEVIVSDNMSNDATSKICRDFKRRDARVKTWRQLKNIGGNPNFSFVREQAHGRYFMLMGDDDWIDPCLVASCVQFLEHNTDYIAAGGRAVYYRENNITFEGVCLSIDLDDPGARVLDTIENVIDGGTFYALYRTNLINQIPYIAAWGSDYYFISEAAFLGKIKTLSDAVCHRIDNSHKISFDAYLRSSGIVNGQDLDPYGVIASVLFWRIIATADVFKKLEIWDRLKIAVGAVAIINRRWNITGKADLLRIVCELFPDQNIMREYSALRSTLMMEWLNAANTPKVVNWDKASSVLDVFIKLGFSSPSINLEENKLLYELVKTIDTIKDHAFKSDAYKIISLFL